MIALKNKPNVTPPTSTYPHGRLTDDTGSGNGTPIDQQTNNDIHSFLQQLMVDAGVTPNNILDNEYDGFQLNLALGLYINKIINARWGPWKDIALTGTWAAVGSPAPQYRLSNGMVELRGQISGGGSGTVTGNISDLVPGSSSTVWVPISDMSGGGVIALNISTAGALTLNSFTGGHTYSLEGVRYAK